MMIENGKVLLNKESPFYAFTPCYLRYHTYFFYSETPCIQPCSLSHRPLSHGYTHQINSCRTFPHSSYHTSWMDMLKNGSQCNFMNFGSSLS